MKCRYCNTALAPLRSLTDGEFCCDDHRHAFQEEQAERAEVSLEPALQETLFTLPVELHAPLPGSTFLPLCNLEPKEFKSTIAKPAGGLVPPWHQPMPQADPPVCNRLLPVDGYRTALDSDTGLKQQLPAGLEFAGVIALPRFDLDPVAIPVETEPAPQAQSTWESKPVLTAEAEAVPEETPEEIVHPYREIAHSWSWLRETWRNAPTDLKIVTLLLPILLGLAVGPFSPKIKMRFAPRATHATPSVSLPGLPAGSVQQVVETRLKDLHESILNRAAVDLTDDFRTGLDSWSSRSNLTSSWSYDASGFVQPGPLAIFKPSTEMTDYKFQFLGEIDQKGMGCAFRAANLDNYYALKLAVVKPGPLPMIRLVRYAVINGKEERHVEKPLPVQTRADTLYRMAVDVRGGDFTILVQGQVVDFWSDHRLARGGVGFFCNRGEKARLRWVEVSHQYDALGRLCAYLAPYGIEGRSGNFN